VGIQPSRRWISAAADINGRSAPFSRRQFGKVAAEAEMAATILPVWFQTPVATEATPRQDSSRSQAIPPPDADTATAQQPPAAESPDARGR
jgi:hypothetical protein